MNPSWEEREVIRAEMERQRTLREAEAEAERKRREEEAERKRREAEEAERKRREAERDPIVIWCSESGPKEREPPQSGHLPDIV